ncbi:EF1B gamma1 [Carpediemonas membranifera]|uniref:EF1B gamma1 n=1 Tax=Carpediemonas membranifera TaxID=201153 RepID=A0A8J6B1S1_9EUKA|nr:EF1B gamma1 [Carpediemonas membranifera]|eukprot:KAG9396600.1 EF1B gamma1 [Carpediemonas membranifera]
MAKLITGKQSPFGKYAELVAKHCGVALDVEYIADMKQIKSEEHLKLNPLGKIPVLVLDNGAALFESDNIAIALAEMAPALNLLGSCFVARGQVRQWMFSISTDLETKMWPWLAPMIGYAPFNGLLVNNAKNDSLAYFKVLEAHLEKNTFMAGQRLTLADFALVAILDVYFRHLMEKKLRDQYPAVVRHFKMMSELPAYVEVYGAPVLCEKAPQPPKKETPKKEAKKPAAKKEEKPAEPKKAEKKEDPLAALPAPKFPMDEWKRQYSNNDTPDAMKWLWENLDAADYSFWKCTYKYQDELKVGFMTANLCSGFIQRCDPIRKVAFGSFNITKDLKEDHLDMFGVWMTRGTELLEAFTPGSDCEIADAENYTFEKLDHTKPEDKAFIEDVFAWESANNFGGQYGEVLEGKNFK